MTKQQAIQIAYDRFNAHAAAYTAHLFHGAPKPVDADYGYCQGWIIVGEFSICREDCWNHIATYDA